MRVDGGTTQSRVDYPRDAFYDRSWSSEAWRYGESESLALQPSRLRQLDEDRQWETDKGLLIDSDTTPLTRIDFKPHEDLARR